AHPGPGDGGKPGPGAAGAARAGAGGRAAGGVGPGAGAAGGGRGRCPGGRGRIGAGGPRRGGSGLMEFVLTANSPGEVSTWLAPVVRALREKTPGARISVFLVPCAFATGAEKAVVAAMPGVDRAFGPGEYWRHALAVPAVRGFEREGAVLFLGGDPVHALWLGRRLGLPALAYME